MGDQLKRQLQFNNLLRLLEPQPRALEDLAQELPRFLPPPAKPYPDRILDALLALVAWARDPQNPTLPFVQLRLQLWLREQRRMVVRLTGNDSERRLISADDSRPGQGEIFLPLVQCSECHASAWLGRIPAGSQTLDRELRTLYEAFFNHQPELALLYPAADVPPGLARGESLHVCGTCGQVMPAAADRCRSCGAADLVAVFLENAVARLTTADGGSTLMVPASLAPLLEGMPALDPSRPGNYVQETVPPHWLAWLYRHGVIRRVITAEHTGLFERSDREALEACFKANPGAQRFG